MDPKGLVELLVKRLVDNPDEVNITVVEGERSTILELRVNKSDVGKVIGKGGRIVGAVRTLLFAMTRGGNDKRVMLEVIE